MDPTTTTQPTPARSANKLTGAQFIQLSDWLRRPEIKPRVPLEADSKLAAIAAAELGFAITPANLTSAREALGLEKARPATPPTVEERLASLEQQVQALHTASPHLADAVEQTRLNQHALIEAVETIISELGADYRYQNLTSFLPSLRRLKSPSASSVHPFAAAPTTSTPSNTTEYHRTPFIAHLQNEYRPRGIFPLTTVTAEDALAQSKFNAERDLAANPGRTTLAAATAENPPTTFVPPGNAYGPAPSLLRFTDEDAAAMRNLAPQPAYSTTAPRPTAELPLDLPPPQPEPEPAPQVTTPASETP